MIIRSFARYPAACYARFIMNSMVGEHHQLVNDIGLGGLCFNARGWVKPGTGVQVYPSHHLPSTLARGRIAWCRQTQAGHYQLGVAFNTKISQSLLSLFLDSKDASPDPALGQPQGDTA